MLREARGADLRARIFLGVVSRLIGRMEMDATMSLYGLVVELCEIRCYTRKNQIGPLVRFGGFDLLDGLFDTIDLIETQTKDTR